MHNHQLNSNPWDNLAHKYDRLWVQKYSLKPTRHTVLKYIISLISDHLVALNIIDIGCGTGQLLSEISLKYPHASLLGIDKSQSMIDEAIERNIDAVFRQSDISDKNCIIALDGSADIITCCHSFPYYNNKEDVLIKISKALKPDGYAIFVQASVNSTYDAAIMHFVEKTAETADYLSKRAFRELVDGIFEISSEFCIKERFFMPSICGFVLRKI